MIKQLNVKLWGQTVGTLVAEAHRICFYFDAEFVKTGYDIAPLEAPLTGAAVRKGLPVYPAEGKLFGGLPSFLADSLPDHWGNSVFNQWARAHRISERDLTAVDRLAYVGSRGMGALEFEPVMAKEMETSFRVEIADLYATARRAYHEAKSFAAPLEPDLLIESLFKVGTSAGGKRPKAIVHVNPSTGECYSGQVPCLQEGFIPMIIKFDEHNEVPFTRIEYSYYLMACEVGLQMMPSRLLEGDRAVHFLTERFDRNGNEKWHVQTLAALNPDADSYEDLFEVALRIGVRPSEMQRLFLQMVMNVLAANVDDHSKNFSFRMDRTGAWHLAPAYDFTFTVDLSAPAYVNRHSLTISNKNSDIRRADLMAIAERYNIKSAASYIDRALEVTSQYTTFAKEAGVSEEWGQRIQKVLAQKAIDFDQLEE